MPIPGDALPDSDLATVDRAITGELVAQQGDEALRAVGRIHRRYAAGRAVAIHSKLERQLARGHVSGGTLKRVNLSAELEAARP